MTMCIMQKKEVLALGTMSQEEINIALFDEVKRQERELIKLREENERLEKQVSLYKAIIETIVKFNWHSKIS